MKTNSKAEAQFDQDYSDRPTFGSRFDTADLTERVRGNHQTLSSPLVFTTPASNFVAIMRPDRLNETDRQPSSTSSSGHLWITLHKSL
jgi:hypothetical protein